MPVTVSYTTKQYPKLPYPKIAAAILGKQYELSLVFVGDTRAKKINQTTRGKDYIPNVLSFPLDNDHGEIYIAPSVATREASKFDLTPTGYITYLFIHGCVHLTGLDHGPTMDTLEAKYMKRFKVS